MLRNKKYYLEFMLEVIYLSFTGFTLDLDFPHSLGHRRIVVVCF